MTVTATCTWVFLTDTVRELWEDTPAVSCMQQWQLARGFKQDHDSTRAVMRIQKGDSYPCHLYRAVQGHNLEPPQGHLQALVY